MKMILKPIALFVCLSTFSVSCGESALNEVAEGVSQNANCQYSLNSDELEVSWGAFKFTEKVQVGGKFDETSVTPSVKSASEPAKLLEDLAVSVKINSINTGLGSRDNTIEEHFFGYIKGDEISGVVKSVSNDKMVISFNMNEIENDVELTYAITDSEITAEGEIDMKDWDGESAMKGLNDACDDLHKGADGLSVLHPDVKISFSIPLSKTCE